MRLLALVPVLVLIGLGIVTWAALREAPPVDFPYWDPPPGAVLTRPEPPVGAAVLAGRLLAPDGLGIQGGRVSAIGRDRLLWTYAGADGEFRLEELDPGPVDVQVLAVGFLPATFALVAGADPVELRLTPAPDRPELPELAWSDLTGRVLAEGHPSDLAGYEVALLPVSAPEELGGVLPRRATVEARGRFALPELAHGTYRVLLLPPWARGASGPDLATRLVDPPRTFEHPGGAPLELTPVAGEIHGRVREPGGERFVEGALVLARPVGDDSALVWPPAVTDHEGAFLIPDLPPGRYRVSIVAGEERLEREATVHPQARIELDL
jgi:hypothetical protein